MTGANESDELPAAGPAKQPLYAALAALLVRDIQAGTYPPASALPSEKELSDRYGVSRQTVRQALRSVRDQGLISSLAGIGTIVKPPLERPTRFSSVGSIEDVLHGPATEMHAQWLREVTVDPALARRLECDEGVALSEAAFLRKEPGAGLPLSFLLLYVPRRFAAALKTPPVSSTPIYQNVERLFGIRVHAVRQDIRAMLLDSSLAAMLQAEPGSAGLEVKRFYYDAANALVQTSISCYPADRHTQSTLFRTGGDFA